MCEGCGDCSVQSNCLSVEPLETEFGRKRRINQNTCNKDYSCVKGFCPSFVTVEGGTYKAKAGGSLTGDGKARLAERPDPFALPSLPQPVLPVAEAAWGIVVAGVGGTGVITIGQLLGMAAHLEGKGIITQDAAGLAQKGGATWSHIQIANRSDAILTTKVGTAEADLVIGCDPIVAANKSTLAVMRQGRTFVALNTHATPTAAFVTDPDWQFPAAQCDRVITDAVGADGVGRLDAERLAVALVGDSLYTNPLLLGYAWQRGRVPLGHAALMRAIELNNVQVDRNKLAFEWGRRAAHEPAAVEALASAASGSAQVIEFARKPKADLDAMVTARIDFLTAYQSAAYAERYRAFVDKVRSAEAAFPSRPLTEAVARYLFKLMAYKDEYEVARLHVDTGFRERIAAQFEGDFRLRYHLAPPVIARRNAAGELQKSSFGPWMASAFRLLAGCKGLRGSVLDPFGRTDERRAERALIDEYRDTVDELLGGLDAGNLALATEIARLPEDIRGYGHVKNRHLAKVRPKWAALMARWRTGGGAERRAA